MALPYDPRFNKKKTEAKQYPCGVCNKPFPDLGQMLQHEDVCSGEVAIPAEESEEQIPGENKDVKTQSKPPIIQHKPNLPYGYGNK